MKFFYNQSHNRGYTLIELIVVVSIVGLVSAVIFANYPRFRSRVALDNTAHEIALAIRQAQVYGIGVQRGLSGAGVSGVYQPYGIYFSVADPQHYTLFIDKNGNQQYDVGGGELVEQTTIGGDKTINSIQVAGTTLPSNTYDNVVVLFQRPNPDAKILTKTLAGTLSTPQSDIRINVGIVGTASIETITVSAVGQISVQ